MYKPMYISLSYVLSYVKSMRCFCEYIMMSMMTFFISSINEDFLQQYQIANT